MKRVKVEKVNPKKSGTSAGKGKKVLINLLVTLVFGFGYFYIELPAINLQDQSFYFFFFLLSAVYCVTAIITSGIWKLRGQDDFFRSIKNNFKAPLAICAALLLLLLVGSLLSGVIVRARAYSKLLPVETGDFATDVAEISFDRIPMLDSDSAKKLGDRKLGELSDMVSQFEVADNYTQINYNDRPVRVTPLEYGDIIKWLNNRRAGLPAYILIDMVTQNVEVVRLEEGMRYTMDEYFMRYLPRHLRFRYPTFMFDTPVFEIDEDGDPYWVCPRIVKTIGLFGGKDVRGVVLVNAVTGETAYYEDIPTWIDRAYSAELIIAQYDYHGQYQSGFLNSLFGQRGVTVTTDGYNYIAMNDDVYVYTGITSVGGDQSNIGFILSNQRTKDTKFYEVAGAEEYSAMSSAQGIVQHLGYRATFPLLLNISGEPTYFMALKDSAGLVKMYAMVNVRQYQLVANGTSVAECERNYNELLISSNVTHDIPVDSTDLEGVVSEIRSAVIDGNTTLYLRIEGGSGLYYAVKVSDFPDAVTVNTGDIVKISYLPAEDTGIRIVDAFSIVKRADSIVMAPGPVMPDPGDTGSGETSSGDQATGG